MICAGDTSGADSCQVSDFRTNQSGGCLLPPAGRSWGDLRESASGWARPMFTGWEEMQRRAHSSCRSHSAGVRNVGFSLSFSWGPLPAECSLGTGGAKVGDRPASHILAPNWVPQHNGLGPVGEHCCLPTWLGNGSTDLGFPSVTLHPQDDKPGVPP